VAMRICLEKLCTSPSGAKLAPNWRWYLKFQIFLPTIRVISIAKRRQIAPSGAKLAVLGDCRHFSAKLAPSGATWRLPPTWRQFGANLAAIANLALSWRQIGGAKIWRFVSNRQFGANLAPSWRLPPTKRQIGAKWRYLAIAASMAPIWR